MWIGYIYKVSGVVLRLQVLSTPTFGVEMSRTDGACEGRRRRSNLKCSIGGSGRITRRKSECNRKNRKKNIEERKKKNRGRKMK